MSSFILISIILLIWNRLLSNTSFFSILNNVSIMYHFIFIIIVNVILNFILLIFILLNLGQGIINI